MSLTVENLPDNYSQEVFAEEFKKFGQCKMKFFVKLIQVRSAFVEYDDEASASIAINTWNNQSFEGSVLRVEENYLDSQYFESSQGPGDTPKKSPGEADSANKLAHISPEPQILEAQGKSDHPPAQATEELTGTQATGIQEGEVNQDQQGEEGNQQEEQPVDSEVPSSENAPAQTNQHVTTPPILEQPSSPKHLEQPKQDGEDMDIDEPEVPENPSEKTPEEAPKGSAQEAVKEAAQVTANEVSKEAAGEEDEEDTPDEDTPDEDTPDEDSEEEEEKAAEIVKADKRRKKPAPKPKKNQVKPSKSPRRPPKKRPEPSPEPRVTRAQQAKTKASTRKTTSKSPSSRDPIPLPQRRTRAASAAEAPEETQTSRPTDRTYVHVQSGTVFNRLSPGMLQCTVCLKEVKQQSAHSHVKTSMHRIAINPFSG